MTQCEKDSHFYKTINNEKVGICIDRSDYEHSAQMITLLRDNRFILKVMEKNSKEYGDKYYSSAVNAIRYVETLNSLKGD